MAEHWNRPRLCTDSNAKRKGAQICFPALALFVERRARVSKLQKTQRSRGRFATALGLLVVVQMLFLITGCARIPSATFRNPKFSCPSSDVVEGYYQQYPFEPQQKSVTELEDFCARMKQRFANSNMTNKEAEQFYTLLKETNGQWLPDGHLLYLHNESYGMPGPERPKPFVFEKQVMLRKVTEEKYEIFYYHIDCGRNYTHEEISLDNGNITQVTTVEIWSESYPC